MDGEKLYSELISKRDYSGSKADEYAQLLTTLFFQIGEPIFALLETAATENKTLAINPELENSDVLVDEYTIQDIVIV